MKRDQEPRLCPNCPLRPWLSEVKKESWTNEPNNEIDLKLCMRLRALSITNPRLPKCPYYPKTEDMSLFNGSLFIPHEKEERFLEDDIEKVEAEKC